MKQAVGVEINGSQTITYYDSTKFSLKKNITVIVETSQGPQFGIVKKLRPQTKSEHLPKIIRISSKKDYQRYLKNRKDADTALKKAKELVQKYKLNMNIIDANYTFDRDKLIFRFTAESRIDFRTLAKDLAALYKVRIELRQIGARDKAKEISGVGICGQKLCCSRFLKDLDAVSINMAKNQNLALNPSKINGACGRLMCCLKYEDEGYTCAKKCMLKIGDKIDTPNGEGTVIGLDILKQKYKVKTKDNTIVMVDKK